MPLTDTSPAAQQQLKALAPVVLDAYPNMQTMAIETAREILAKHGLAELDPDHVYWHRFSGGYSDPATYTGWSHNEKQQESMTLTQLVIHRFNVHDQDNADLLDGDGGFYLDGPEARLFDHHNEVRLSARTVLDDFWAINFCDRYTTRMEDFWSAHFDDFRTLAKVNCLAQALQARQAGHLTEPQLQTVLQALASNLPWPPTLSNLHAESPTMDGLRVAALDIGGHIATDILRIVDHDGRQILYVPGDAQAFHCCETPADLHFWLLNQTNHPDNRARFMAHFPLSAQVQQDDTDAVTWKQMLLTPVLIYRTAQALTGTLPPDWVDKGLYHQLDQLFIDWGTWNHHLINQTDQTIEGDAFTWLAQSSQARMHNDADFSLRSNGDLRKKLWIGYLNAFGKTFGPMAVAGWPVALVVVGASVANLGLNIDQAINGKTLAERRAGALGAILSAIDTLFNLALLKADGVMPDIAEATETLAAETTLPTERPAPPPIPEPTVPAAYQTNLILEGETLNTAPGKFQQIYSLRSTEGMPQHAILLDDQAYYVRYEGDPNGRGYWAIVDPNNPHGFSGTLAVRLNEFNEWERVPGAKGLKGGGGNSSKAAKKTPPSPTPPPSQPVAQSPSDVHRVTTPFDTPPSTRPEVKRWAMGLNETHVQSRFGRIDRFTHYYGATHRKLLQLAQDFYNELPWTRLPARPNIPAFEPTATLDEALERLPDEIPGYVIGETLDRVASTRLVIEKMPLFARKGVKTLYMRRLLNDFAQDDLNLYFRTGVMSEDLENHLSQLGTDPSGQFNELELVKAARDNGIRVQAIDCAAHYKYPNPVADLSEQVTSNYLAHTLIQTDRALNGGGKWLVLTGARNINTFNGFAGLSELEGGIGLRIEEVLPGQGHDVRLDPGVAMDRDNAPLPESTGDSFDTFHADLRVQVEAPLVRRTVQQNHRLLFRKGMYLIDESQGNYTLLHHSRDRGIVSTPINRLADGSVYIDRPAWAAVHNVHFPTLEKLSSALTNMGMSLQSRLPI
ncbi:MULTISPECIES: membrane-targeted effector domain-containing toxin [unclassified Pseudomonas]|uniref:membrane-targeted effector domain-containing toxin n=1 Tax=unclassified Pseudomonas TaxID=196821 RepID=UPI000F58199E|nr:MULTISPECIES: membrane-targeted effector domain-containing toxin [unclassified Pseudomonas]AZF49480.1 hypothetical protein C4J86_4275 [Pseudomonas sp. R2-7-07]AZF59968.1 hypothetical protein C4J84_4121 [Pseudomonas sp. R11-23-07]